MKPINKVGSTSLLTAAFSFALALSSQAAPLTILNNSFESPILADNTVTNGSTDWVEGTDYYGVAQSRTANLGTGLSLVGPTTAQNGENAFLVTGTRLFRQDLSSVYLANTEYSLTGYIAAGQSTGSGTLGFGYGILRTSATMTLNNVVASNSSAAGATWNLVTATFTTGAADTFLGQNIVVFGINNTVDGANYILFDNLQMTAGPEPSTYALLLAGLCAVVAFRSRRTAKSAQKLFQKPRATQRRAVFAFRCGDFFGSRFIERTENSGFFRNN